MQLIRIYILLFHTTLCCDTFRLVSSHHQRGQIYGNYVRVHNQILLHWAQKLIISFGLLKNPIPCLSIYSHLTIIPNFISSQIFADIIIPFHSRSTNPPFCGSSLVSYSFHRPFLSSVLNMPKLSYSLCLFTSYCGCILTSKSFSSIVLILHLHSWFLIWLYILLITYFANALNVFPPRLSVPRYRIHNWLLLLSDFYRCAFQNFLLTFF